MANVFGTFWKTKIPSPVGLAQTICVPFTETFAPGALNDTRKLLQLPYGVTIGANSYMQVGDMDSGTALVLTLRISNGTTTKVLIDASTVGQAGGIIRPTKIGTTENAVGFTTDSHGYYLELLIATAATGAQSALFTYAVDMTGFFTDQSIKK